MLEAKHKKKIDIRSMAKRLFSSLLMWGIVAAVFFSREICAVALTVVVLAVLGNIDYIRITKSAPGHKMRWGTFIISICYMGWLAWDLFDFNSSDSLNSELSQRFLSFTPEIVGLLLAVLLVFVLSLFREIKGLDSINAVGLSILGYIFVPVLFGGFMLRLIFLPPSPEVSGVWLLLFVAVVTKFTDMGAYLSGTLFGKTKMVKHISPGKTWEGAIGSFLVAQIGAFTVCYLAGERLAWMGDWKSIMLLSIIISIAAIIGDLAESVLKRSVEVKDSGDVLPGIGGMLDLIDSICFSAPVAYFYLLITMR